MMVWTGVLEVGKSQTGLCFPTPAKLQLCGGEGGGIMGELRFAILQVHGGFSGICLVIVGDEMVVGVFRPVVELSVFYSKISECVPVSISMIVRVISQRFHKSSQSFWI